MSGLRPFLPSGGDAIIKADVPVTLGSGRSVGKYGTGSVIPAARKGIEAVLRDLASETLFPTYTVAGVGLSANVPLLGEIGEALQAVLTAQFYRGDAGPVTLLRIVQHLNSTTATLGQAAADSTAVTVPVRRTAQGSSFAAVVSYTAGAAGRLVPSGEPDPRPAAIRSAHNPQAAETNLPSALLRLSGAYRVFYGPSSVVPTSSSDVRALGNNPLLPSTAGQVTLDTGSTTNTFVLALPFGLTLRAAVDLSGLNANVLNEYRPQTVDVEDAAGALVPYTVYVMNPAVAYTSNHLHQLTFN